MAASRHMASKTNGHRLPPLLHRPSPRTLPRLLLPQPQTRTLPLPLPPTRTLPLPLLPLHLPPNRQLSKLLVL